MNFNHAYRILKSYTERKATGGRTSHYDIDEAIKTVLPILAEKYDKDCEEAYQRTKTHNIMKTKTIPFDLETAKKIQAGEIKGKIKTREGKDVRVVCWDKKSELYPIVALVVQKADCDGMFEYTNKGELYDRKEFFYDLVLEVPDNEPQFKPFDRVLVRDRDNDKWTANFFSHIDNMGYYRAGGFQWQQCIPYESNEDLVGIT